MKSILFQLFSILFATSLFGQSETGYYFQAKDTSIYSNFLNENRKITISLPKTYSKQNATKLPLILIFDRQNIQIYRQNFETINSLVAFNEVPAAIVVGISSETKNRFLETSLKTSVKNAKGENMEKFVFDELLPWLEKNYNVGKIRTFIGHSRFGYFTTHLLAKRMNEVSAIISMSPFYLQENVNLVDSLKRALTNTDLKHNVYHRFITGDSIMDSKDYKIMHSYLKNGKINLKFNWKGYEYYNVTHLAVPTVSLAPCLIDIFDFWSKELTEIEWSKIPLSEKRYVEFKNKMTKHYGYEVGIGLSALNGIGYTYYNKENYKDAIIVWNLLLKEYPMFTYSNISIAKAYLKANDKKNASVYLEKAKIELLSNTFYSSVEKQEIEAEIKKLNMP